MKDSFIDNGIEMPNWPLKEYPSKAKLFVEAMKKDNPYLVTDLGRKKS